MPAEVFNLNEESLTVAWFSTICIRKALSKMYSTFRSLIVITVNIDWKTRDWPSFVTMFVNLFTVRSFTSTEVIRLETVSNHLISSIPWHILSHLWCNSTHHVYLFNYTCLDFRPLHFRNSLSVLLFFYRFTDLQLPERKLCFWRFTSRQQPNARARNHLDLKRQLTKNKLVWIL